MVQFQSKQATVSSLEQERFQRHCSSVCKKAVIRALRLLRVGSDDHTSGSAPCTRNPASTRDVIRTRSNIERLLCVQRTC